MRLPDTSIHVGGSLIDNTISRLIDEKVAKFRKLKMNDANFHELVGGLADYEFIVRDTHAGGWASKDRKEICLQKATYDLSVTAQWRQRGSDVWMPAESLKRIILLHEIGHTIQFEAERYEQLEYTLSESLKLEWQTESIAYSMYNKMFGKISHKLFDSYFKKEDVEFLRKWHGSYLQDDLKA